MAHHNQPAHPFIYGLDRNEYRRGTTYLSPPNDPSSAHRPSRSAGDSSSWSYISDDRQSWQNVSHSSATDLRIGTPSVNSDRPHRRLYCPICQKCYQGQATLANHLKSHTKVLMCVECTEDCYNMQDNILLWACGFCVTGQLYNSNDGLHKHIAKEHGGGDVSPGWDISLVMRNHLEHEVLQGHFRQWLRETYPHLSNNPPTLIWIRSPDTHALLRYLQTYPHANMPHEDARSLVYQICNNKSQASGPVRDNVTPSNVGELTYGVGQSLPHPQATNPDEAEEELPTTEPPIALSKYNPLFLPSSDYMRDLDELPTADIPTWQYANFMEPTTANDLLNWSHTNVYPPLLEMDEMADSEDPLYNTLRSSHPPWG